MKLLELLVKKRIEWHPEALCYTQDADNMRVYPYKTENPTFKENMRIWAWNNVISGCALDMSELADDWQTAIVTKEQYDNACKLVDDGYTLWFGGECPVRPREKVRVVLDDGNPDGNNDFDRASDWRWEWDDGLTNIIAYKVVKPVLISTHKHDASLEQFYAHGWTDEQLIEHGYAKVAEPGEMEPFRPGLSCEVVPGKPLGVREPIGFNCRCSSVPVVTEYPAHSFLEKGIQHMKDRAAQRDSADGERSMAACVNAFNAMFGKDLTETQGWQFMVLLKMARSRNKFNPDDYEDGAAYTGLAGEAHSHE